MYICTHIRMVQTQRRNRTVTLLLTAARLQLAPASRYGKHAGHPHPNSENVSKSAKCRHDM